MKDPLVESMKERLREKEPSYDEDVKAQEKLEQTQKELVLYGTTTRRRMAYFKFTQSPEWRKLRNEALRRDGYICAACGGSATMVHHVAYPREDSWPETPLWALISLCSSCHKDAHGLRGAFRIFDRSGVAWTIFDG